MGAPDDRPESPAPVREAGGAADERALVARIAMRDRAALRTLYFLYHKRLSRFLLRIVGRPELVEEIINDTMFTVWRKAAEFRGDSQVSTWILGIAYRQGLKGLKRLKANQRFLPLPDLAGVDLSADLATDAGAEQREQREYLDRALDSLPAVQRLVIELAYYLGHSCEEIALITECPVNTVKTRMFHARARLRAIMGER